MKPWNPKKLGFGLMRLPRKDGGEINIPEVFVAMNLQLANGQLAEAREAYAAAIGAPGARSAADCIACGQCEAACPQHLPIIARLAEAAEQLG